MQTTMDYNEMYFIDNILQHLIEPIEMMPTEFEENFVKISNTLFATDCQGVNHDRDYFEGRISLAYEKLTMIPKSIADTFASCTKILDLSHNNISDLKFLTNFSRLNSLILDKNSTLNEKTLPHLPSLKLLWLNHCEIDNIIRWIRIIQMKCPQITYLSLLGNPGATTLFNGSSPIQHNVYRLYVIEHLPTLLYLDDSVITDEQRAQAKSHRYLNGLVNVFSFINKIGQTPNKEVEPEDNIVENKLNDEYSEMRKMFNASLGVEVFEDERLSKKKKVTIYTDSTSDSE